MLGILSLGYKKLFYHFVIQGLECLGFHSNYVRSYLSLVSGWPVRASLFSG